ncbi:MAG: hypothetical protein ABI137_00395 [Antricoccus sp.]
MKRLVQSVTVTEWIIILVSVAFSIWIRVRDVLGSPQSFGLRST